MIQEYNVLISLDMKRGFHDSRCDFPPSAACPSQYALDCNTSIVLEFANKIYQLPGMFMHYIDDVASIGWSWIPPRGFINCLEMGYDPDYKGDKQTKHHIGYLTKKDNLVVDEGDVPAELSQHIAIDDEVLDLLKRIAAFVEASTDLHKDSREAFSSKAPERRYSLGMGGSRK